MIAPDMPDLNKENEKDESVEWIRQWIQSHTGIFFPNEKMCLLAQRLAGLRAKIGLSTNHDLVARLADGQNAEMMKHLLDVATTNHTHFFREQDTLDFFKSHIMPELPSVEPWRIWSAASSSGEELYTLAIMLCQTMGTESVRQKVSFLGTDINPKVIEEAERGIYNEQRLQTTDAGVVKRWFKPAGLGTWMIAQEIKQLCLFRRLNLKQYPWPFTRFFHVVFLRNILYYFDLKTQEEIVNQIYSVTLPGGWLVTSVTESLSGFQTQWQRVRAGVYRKPE